MSLSRKTVLAFVSLVLSAAVAHARMKNDRGPRPDPFKDPAHDPYNPLRYIASNVLTAIAFTLILLVALGQTLLMRKYGAKFMLAMVIGGYCFAFGIGTRFGLHAHPQSKGIYIVEYLFVVLSPCAFIASEYVLLGRLAQYLRCDKYLVVNPRRITWVFISSDITTFLIQASTTSLIGPYLHEVSRPPEQIFLAGLVMQLASFLIFSCIYTVFIYRVHKHEPEVWTIGAEKWYQDWRALAAAMAFSFFGILLRSGYRVAELSEGFQGPLAINEALFYGLDTLPLFIAIATYIFFWPGRIIGDGTPVAKESSIESVEK
ncbi:RTA1-like protein [Mycena rebaudengoi]|nr:RTA1-like protein [Mycena rebaudengoi]